MVMDSKFAELRTHFQIRNPEDWQSVTPSVVLSVPGIGPQTLNHLRLHLANQGLTLQDDETPAYWQSNLSILRGTSQIADSQKAIATSFTILVDKAEQHPFTFAGFKTDADQGNRPLVIQTRPHHLGPSRGDYSIGGLEGEIHVERKSREDVQGTVLGWGDRREQFERTLTFLAEIPSSAVIVECTLGEAIKSLVSRGKKSKAEMQKIFHRQVMAWHDDYRVPWVFCDSRRLAEITTFRWLQRYHRHHQARLKQASKADSSKSESLEFPGL